MDLASRISSNGRGLNVRRLARGEPDFASLRALNPIAFRSDPLLQSGEHVLRRDVGPVQADGALTTDLAVNQPPAILDQR